MAVMANHSYLSVWCKDFPEELILERLGEFLGTVPFSATKPGFTYLAIRAVDATESPILEQDLRAVPHDAAGIVEIARDQVHSDCSYEVGCHWDLAVFDAGVGRPGEGRQRLLQYPLAETAVAPRSEGPAGGPVLVAGPVTRGLKNACRSAAGPAGAARRVQAWRVSDERAETYLRLRAEVELRRAADRLRGLDTADRPDDRADPGMAPFATAERAQWKVIRAGRILVAAGALEEEFLARLAADLDGTIKARSRILLNWDRRRGVLYHNSYIATPSSTDAPQATRRLWPLASMTEATVNPSGILCRKMARKMIHPSQLETRKPEAMAMPSKNV